MVLEGAGRPAEAHLVVVGILACDGASARGVRVVPVLHVVLLGEPRRAGVADVVLAEEPLDLWRRVRVDEIPAPCLGLVRPARVPRGECPWLPRERRRV